MVLFVQRREDVLPSARRLQDLFSDGDVGPAPHGRSSPSFRRERRASRRRLASDCACVLYVRALAGCMRPITCVPLLPGVCVCSCVDWKSCGIVQRTDQRRTEGTCVVRRRECDRTQTEHSRNTAEYMSHRVTCPVCWGGDLEDNVRRSAGPG